MVTICSGMGATNFNFKASTEFSRLTIKGLEPVSESPCQLPPGLPGLFPGDLCSLKLPKHPMLCHRQGQEYSALCTRQLSNLKINTPRRHFKNNQDSFIHFDKVLHLHDTIQTNKNEISRYKSLDHDKTVMQ